MMKPETAKKLVQPFDPSKLKELRGMTYVPVAEVTNRCNGVLGVGNWRPEVLNTETWGVQETQFGPCPVHIVATMRVHVRDDETGEWTWADGMGGQDVNFYKDRAKGPTNLGDAYKGACSDGMKKALQHFGVGLELARDGQVSETYERTVDLMGELDIVDDADVPRFNEVQKQAIKAEWMKRRFGFKLSEVPESKVQFIKSFLTSFEGWKAPQESETNAQERSDGGAVALTEMPQYNGALTAEQAKQVMGAVLQSVMPEQKARREAKSLWNQSGYEGITEIGGVEWSILTQMVNERLEKAKAA